ncbi:ion transporter [Aureivirga sp. CE67]|uniref:ion transporter n=1 Tax=Aureivirga sp. CE67 TaxID=1788983 RepID=UPI0018C91BA9|nr:ion transporter [Aureivirga sp. CE67]
MEKRERDWREKLHEIIYEADTPAGKNFDIVLLILILSSLVVVMIESVEEYRVEYHGIINIVEWIITILFSIEYILRIITVKKPFRYIFSFYGLIDLVSTIPKYLSFFFGGANVLIAVRILRLLRVFRILKLARFIGESNMLKQAIKASRAKISVFLLAVLSIAVILGTVMYLVEGPEAGFTSIPTSIYWTIVTLTTVGYGDIAPQTSLGQFIASVVMILGYGIIAVPTGIVTSELTRKEKDLRTNTQSCRHCGNENHLNGAKYCHECGEHLH